MPAPDVTTLTDDELAETIKRANIESKKRGQFAEAETFLLATMQTAKELGATKAQVAAFLTRLVNTVYP